MTRRAQASPALVRFGESSFLAGAADQSCSYGDGSFMQWICDLCGYVHEEEESPHSCPVCGAEGKGFTPAYEDESGSGEAGPRMKGMDDFERDLFADYDDD